MPSLIKRSAKRSLKPSDSPCGGEKCRCEPDDGEWTHHELADAAIRQAVRQF